MFHVHVALPITYSWRGGAREWETFSMMTSLSFELEALRTLQVDISQALGIPTFTSGLCTTTTCSGVFPPY